MCEYSHFFIDEDYEFDMPLPLTMTFATNHTRLPVSFTLNNDDIEEGYENFTLQLSYNEEDEDGTVRIMTEFALVSIKDDDGAFLVQNVYVHVHSCI